MSGQTRRRPTGQVRYLSGTDRAQLLLIRLVRDEAWTAPNAGRALLAHTGIDRSVLSRIRARIIRAAAIPPEGLSVRMLLTLDHAELGLA